MTWRSCWLGIATMAIALTFAAQAAATPEPKAKFRIVSASGREALSFHEESKGEVGGRCVGTTVSQVRWRMTRPLTVYVFLFRYGGKLGTNLSTDRVPERYGGVTLVGQATVSRTVNYPETAGCYEEPTNCPETTAPAEPFLSGVISDIRLSVNAGINDVHVPRGFDFSCRGTGTIAFGIAPPFGDVRLPGLTVQARVVPRRQLFDLRRHRLHDSVTVEQPFSASEELFGGDRVTLSGTYTDHLAITLKRLPLRR